MRRLLQRLFAFILKLYFRRIEVYGQKHIPKEGPVIFVLNHTNALVDPLFILCFSPRNVSFLAKSTLFSMPIVGSLTRGFDSIPIYRKQDGAKPNQNKEMFAQCRDLLKRGGALALFPEGISHNETHLMPLKTGTARIALGAASGPEQLPLQIVPAGLYFTQKDIFRSDALLYYGEPIEVASVTLDEQGEPPKEATYALTDQLKEALSTVILEAQHEEALNIVTRAEKIFSSGRRKQPLSNELALRKQFVRAYETLQQDEEPRLTALKMRIEQYEAKLKRWGITTSDIRPDAFTLEKVVRFTFFRLLLPPLLIPLALIGSIVNYLPYRLIGFIASRMAKGEVDMFSTLKILASLLFYPLAWGICGGLGWYLHSPLVGVLAFLAAPLTAWCATVFWEHLPETWWRTKAFVLFLLQRSAFDALKEERDAIRAELVTLGELATQHEMTGEPQATPPS